MRVIRSSSKELADLNDVLGIDGDTLPKSIMTGISERVLVLARIEYDTREQENSQPLSHDVVNYLPWRVKLRVAEVYIG